MPNFILTSPYNGIAQDSFFGDTGECAYMENINNDEMKYEQLDKTFTLISGGNTGVTTNVNQFSETPAGVINCGDSKILLNGGDVSATLAGAKRHEYTLDSSGNQVNYFIDNTNVYKIDANITAITTTTAHAGGSGSVTASCLVYNDIIYARGSTILKYDATTTTASSLASNVPIRTGSTVKYMYFYNDMVYIVTTLGFDTIIYMVQYTSSGYGIYGNETMRDEVCVGAVGNGAIIYWVTTTTIWGFSGTQSTFLRYIGKNVSLDEATFGQAKLAYGNRFLYIANGNDIYKYGSKYQGRRASLTKKTYPQTILGITSRYINTQTTTNFIYTLGSKYPDSGFSISLPFDGGVYGDRKDGLKFQVGYQLPTGTTIQIGVLTDEMEMVNTSTYVTVATISDTTKRVQTIDVNTINTALANAGYSSEWQNIRFKRILNGGGGTSGARNNTPRLFEIKALYDNTKDNLSE